MGVKYFILDTFKMDAGDVSDKSWLEMQQNMVEINDVIKPESKNLHILITFQLAKGSVKQRYYTQDNIGMSKNIIDPASTCIMIRDLYDDEYTGERRELKVYRLEGKNGQTKIPIKTSKHFTITFDTLGGTNVKEEKVKYGEKAYYSMVYTLCSVGADLKWQLDDIGVDYTQIDDFELFYSLLSRSYSKEQTRIA